MFKTISSFENLLQAYSLCLKDNRYKQSRMEFDFNLEENLAKLQWLLQNGFYKPYPYTYFTVCDSKKRNIAAPAFRDRVIQHALVLQIEPLFEKQFIFDSYACRKAKGTHFGLRRLKKFLQAARSVHGKNTAIYVLQADIQKFFPGVSWDILLRLIKRKITDPLVFELIRRIVVFHRVCRPNKKSLAFFNQSLSLRERRGLPIGNLTSQLFANIYLNELDGFVKQNLKIRWYGRYMDDFFIISSDKENLKNVKKAMQIFLEEKLRLSLHPQKTIIQNVSLGVPFVGYRVFYDHILVRGKTLLRMSRKYKARKKQKAKGWLSQKSFEATQASLRGHLKFANTHNLSKYFFREKQSESLNGYLGLEPVS